MDKPPHHSTRYACHLCKATYKRMSHLRRHGKSHSEFKEYRCAVCGREFVRTDTLTRHRNLFHPDADELRRREASVLVGKSVVGDLGEAARGKKSRRRGRVGVRGRSCTYGQRTVAARVPKGAQEEPETQDALAGRAYQAPLLCLRVTPETEAPPEMQEMQNVIPSLIGDGSPKSITSPLLSPIVEPPNLFFAGRVHLFPARILPAPAAMGPTKVLLSSVYSHYSLSRDTGALTCFGACA